MHHKEEGERSGLEVNMGRVWGAAEKRRGIVWSVQHGIQVCVRIPMWPGPQSDDGPRGVARHGVPCHNFNPAMHVVAENILVSLLTSARGRVVRAHGHSLHRANVHA